MLATIGIQPSEVSRHLLWIWVQKRASQFANANGPGATAHTAAGNALIDNVAQNKADVNDPNSPYDMADLAEKKKVISSPSSTAERSEVFEPKPSSETSVPQNPPNVNSQNAPGDILVDPTGNNKRGTALSPGVQFPDTSSSSNHIRAPADKNTTPQSKKIFGYDELTKQTTKARSKQSPLNQQSVFNETLSQTVPNVNSQNALFQNDAIR